MSLDDLFTFINNQAENAVKADFQKKKSFLISKEALPEDHQDITIETRLTGSKKSISIDTLKADHIHEYWVEVELNYSYTLFKAKKNIVFNFWIIGYLERSNSISREIVDPIKLHLKELHDVKIGIRRFNELPLLHDIESEYFSPNVISKFSEVCRRKSWKMPYDDFNALDDLSFTANLIVYSISELIILKPYIRDFLEHPIYLQDKTVYGYFPTFYDDEYFNKAASIIQSIQTYWDKIAHILHHFFDLPLKKREIYFTKVIRADIFPKQFQNESYKWLHDFREGLYKKNNEERNTIVHELSLSAKNFKQFIESIDDEEVLRNLQKEKMGLADDFILQYHQMIEGFEQVVKLIDTLIQVDTSHS